MTTTTAKEKKIALEKIISNLLIQYEQESGLLIENIRLKELYKTNEVHIVIEI